MAALLITACKTPKLAPGGAYTTTITNMVGTNIVLTSTSDLGLYTADSSFKLAYQTLDTVFTFERNNRQYLWNLSPAIKHTLDQVRAQAWPIVGEYVTARAAYLANPTPAGLTGVNAVLAKIQQLVFAANAVLSTSTPTTNSVTH